MFEELKRQYRRLAPLVETSANFDMDNVGPFMERVSGVIPSGFGPAEVAQVVALAQGMEVNDEQVLTFNITFAGQPIQLYINVFLDDVDAPDVYFFSTPALIKKIEEIMREDFE